MENPDMRKELYPWQPGTEDQILVFAPHPDDEVLAAGGLIATVLESASSLPLRVVVATNGDASYATALLQRGHSLSKQNFRRIALNRQQETRSTLAFLGLNVKQICFWGFPDRGLTPIWQYHWDSLHPYYSPTTGFVRSEQAMNSPVLPYTATNLLSLLEKELIEFQPTIIVMPHPEDAQSDHQMLAHFTLLAVSFLYHESPAPLPTMLAYMMWRHENPWLTGMRLNDPSLLPEAQNGAKTYYLTLAAAIQEKKVLALQCYRSQKFSARQLLKEAAQSTREYFVQIRPYSIPRYHDVRA